MRKLSEQEIKENLESLDGWEMSENGIQTSFEFENFKEAFTLMTRIAFEAESMDHHPNWTNVYNTLEITLITHAAGELQTKIFNLQRQLRKLSMQNEINKIKK